MPITKPQFKVGDKVCYINEAGINWGEKEIIEVDRITYSASGFGYYLYPTACPWYAVQEERLTKINHSSGKRLLP